MNNEIIEKINNKCISISNDDEINGIIEFLNNNKIYDDIYPLTEDNHELKNYLKHRLKAVTHDIFILIRYIRYSEEYNREIANFLIGTVPHNKDYIKCTDLIYSLELKLI